MANRKLSKPMRMLNLAYKVVMAILAGLSFIFASFTDINPIYYEVVSVFSSAFPIIWDAAKQYETERTPTPTSPAAPAADDTKITEETSI